MLKLIIVLAAIIIFLLIIIRYLWLKNCVLKEDVKNTISKKQSLSTKYGRMTEQFLPFLDQYPYNEQSFRFLGSPIDGVQFEEDKIIFVEFKSGDSKLSTNQKNIRKTIEDKKVYFEEFNLK